MFYDSPLVLYHLAWHCLQSVLTFHLHISPLGLNNTSCCIMLASCSSLPSQIQEKQNEGWAKEQKRGVQMNVEWNVRSSSFNARVHTYILTCLYTQAARALHARQARDIPLLTLTSVLYFYMLEKRVPHFYMCERRVPYLTRHVPFLQALTALEFTTLFQHWQALIALASWAFQGQQVSRKELRLQTLNPTWILTNHSMHTICATL